ncbi:MAG TPA: hypothetical protein DGO43_05045 [Chloroflexi bacterium]|nr:hypothetical protein [Chloroflexota bacterium]
MSETIGSGDKAEESSMLIVAPEAALALRAALDGDRASDELAIRISFDAGGRMHMAPSDIQKGDKWVFFDNRVILVAAPEVSEVLAGHTLLIRKSNAGSTFALRRTSGGQAD